MEALAAVRMAPNMGRLAAEAARALRSGLSWVRIEIVLLIGALIMAG